MSAEAGTPALVLPIRVDAVRLGAPVSCVGPTSDYTNLPSVDLRTGHDIHPNTPFVATEAFATPFSTVSILEPGVHVHWALPDSLRRAQHPLDGDGVEQRDRVVFPRVCNRWLVRRRVTSGPQGQVEPDLTRHWLVQSDFLHPEHVHPPHGTISVLLPDALWGHGRPPVRYMGSVSPIDEADGWNPGVEDLGAQLAAAARPGDGWEALSGHPLTAVGPPDEMTFAALYPSCRNVFGMHDDVDADGVPAAAAIHYDVVGLYSENDLVADLVTRSGKTGIAANEFVADRLRLGGAGAPPGWVNDAGTPRRLACVGATTATDPTTSNRQGEQTVHLAMGHRPADALVAFLADEIDEVAVVDRGTTERCLSSLRVGRHLEGQRLDLGPRLDHAMHEAGFEPVEGGTRWRIVRRPTGDGAGGATTSGSRVDEELTLPMATAHLLERLNVRQAAYDRARWGLEWEAETLHCDWARAMHTIYRPVDLPQDMPDPDAAIDWIERRLERPDASGHGVSESLASKMRALDHDLAAVLVAQAAVHAALDHHNRSARPEVEPAWELRPAPGARFWRPTDPALVLADIDRGADTGLVADRGRYGGELASPFVVSGATTIDQLVDGLGGRGRSSDHHPLLLDWEMEVTPVQSGADLRPATRRYDPEWFRRNYRLAETDQDLDRRDPSGDMLAAGLRYEGRALLTPAAQSVLAEEIADWLRRWIEGRLSAWVHLEAPAVDDRRRPDWLGTVARLLATDPPSDAERFEQDLHDRLATARADIPLAADGSGGPRVDDFVNWLAVQERHLDRDHPARMLLTAGSTLETWSTRVLGQSLGGFGRQLVGLVDGPPLSADDPLGFADYRDVTDRVRIAVEEALGRSRETAQQALHRLRTVGDEPNGTAGGSPTVEEAMANAGETLHRVIEAGGSADEVQEAVDDARTRVGAAIDLAHRDELRLPSTRGGRHRRRPRVAPDPWAEFLPIRSGELRPLALRLIDTFGRPTDIRWDRLDHPQTLAARRHDRLGLDPRLTQPARLAFRWLSATSFDRDETHVDVEANDHPATSPVCGYLVANHLDHTILFFAADGRPLGSLAERGRWRPPPGGEEGVIRPAEIPQPTLRRVATWASEASHTRGFIEAYLDTLESALEQIDPEDFHQHTGHAVMASRPVAVVRATMDLQTRGPVSIDQGWHAHRESLAGSARNRRGVDEIEIPVRIGEHRMLDDGVVGFFAEDPTGAFIDDRMYCPQGMWAEGGAHTSGILEWEEGHPALNLWLRLADPPRTITVLMDPRAKLHATTGVLPARALTIPPEQVRDGLGSISLWFQTAPVLSGPDDLELDLAPDPGWSWTWTAKGRGGWERRAPEGYVTADALGLDAWQAAVREHRVAVDPHQPGRGRWKAQPDRPASDPPSPEDQPGDLARLVTDRIVPAPATPRPSATTAREGWLLLRPADDQPEED